MYSYSMIQWLFFFYFYCFAGWCIESAYVSVKERKLTNRGFMRGPFLPLYGSGATMMLVVSMPFRDSVLLTYAAGCVGATILEYVTGVAMEALFKVRYWDYSNQKFNFQGHVCLGTSLAWGFLTILMTEVVHVRVETFVMAIPGQTLTIVTYILTAGIFADFALCFKAAIDLRDILIKMEQAKEEMVHILKRLDAIIASANQEMEHRKAALVDGVHNVREELVEGMAMRMEDVKGSMEGKLETLKSMALKSSAVLENWKEELMELKTKYAVNLADRNRLGGLKDAFQRGMIRSNPTMTSARFKEALEELKQKAAEKKENGTEEQD